SAHPRVSGGPAWVPAFAGTSGVLRTAEKRHSLFAFLLEIRTRLQPILLRRGERAHAVRARLGKRRAFYRIAREQPGFGKRRVDAGDSRVETHERRFRFGDAPAQRRALDALLGGGAADLGAGGTPEGAVRALACGLRGAALGEHELAVIVEIAVERRDPA